MGIEKEKIINGIDVSECSYYNKDNEPYCCEVWDNECEAQNCYFKQFKRLQKENESLKSLNDFNVQKIEVLQEENEELKSRNANLRLNLATYDLPEVKKVLTDWRTGKLDKKFKKLQKENEKIKKQYNCYACGNCSFFK